MRAVVKSIINGDIQFDIENTLKARFDTNDKVNIYYRDVTNLPPIVDGLATFQVAPKPGEVDVAAILNQNTLPNSCQEFIFRLFYMNHYMPSSGIETVRIG